MPRWIEDDQERMRRVETNTASHCMHDVDLDEVCPDCAEEADYEGENDDELMAALQVRRQGDPKPLAELKAKMKGKAHASRA